MKKMNDNELNNVNGGLLVYAQGLPEFNPACPWEVIENGSGNVLGMFGSYYDACSYARSLGPNEYNAAQVDIYTVMDIRNSKKINN
ncbi:MAG: bacteriocin [Lachnospiraceae bacterium]|nr:bacteriocin [Lachnospiraceae bacterium]